MKNHRLCRWVTFLWAFFAGIPVWHGGLEVWRMMDRPGKEEGVCGAAIPGARKLGLSYARGAKKEGSGPHDAKKLGKMKAGPARGPA